jgi:hypothetical protein
VGAGAVLLRAHAPSFCCLRIIAVVNFLLVFSNAEPCAVHLFP